MGQEESSLFHWHYAEIHAASTSLMLDTVEISLIGFLIFSIRYYSMLRLLLPGEEKRKSSSKDVYAAIEYLMLCFLSYFNNYFLSIFLGVINTRSGHWPFFRYWLPHGL